MSYILDRIKVERNYHQKHTGRNDVLEILAECEDEIRKLHDALALGDNAAPWPMPSAAQLNAITFAYEKGFAAGLDDRNVENVFADTGGQRLAFDIGLTEGRNRRRETMRAL